jgi:hypothetical protein
MAERHNSGSIWYNTDKKSDKHPGYSGTLNADGVLYFVDAWVRKTADGKPWISLAVKRRDKQEGAEQRPELRESDDVPM